MFFGKCFLIRCKKELANFCFDRLTIRRGWIIKYFLVVFFLQIDLEVFDHDSSGFVTSAIWEVQFIVWHSFFKNSFTMIKMIIVFLLTLEVILQWMGSGRNLHVYNLFFHKIFCKDGRIYRLSLTMEL